MRDNVHFLCAQQPSELFPTVKRFYKAAGYPAKPGRLEQVFTLGLSDVSGFSERSLNIIGAVRVLCVQRHKERQWHCLRSLVTAPQWRGQGVATQLLAFVFSHGVLQALPVYCFALEGTVRLYQRVGFVITEPALAPTFIREGYEKYRRQGRKISIMIRDLNEV